MVWSNVMDDSPQSRTQTIGRAQTTWPVVNDASDTTSTTRLVQRGPDYETNFPEPSPSNHAAEYNGWLASESDLGERYDRRQQADDYYTMGGSYGSGALPAQAATWEEFSPELDSSSCPLPYRGDFDGDETDFEPVDDLPSLPKLDFKPFILRPWTLAIIILFDAGIITGLSLLYYYDNQARVFHVHATASRFTIRILPSLIGTLSTLVFQSVFTNYARIRPYLDMAKPDTPRARQTLLAAYFPLFNSFNAIQNRHYFLVVLEITRIVLNPFITPLKTSLIHKTPMKEDPNSWAVTISGGTALVLLFLYTIMLCNTIIVFCVLHNVRTGLKWDPVSAADQIMLLQGSNLLDDFSGLEYWSRSLYLDTSPHKLKQFDLLLNKQYRLGYWLHRPSNRYWHGIRRRTTYRDDSGDRGTIPTIADTSRE